jgi:hypothetical protein
MSDLSEAGRQAKYAYPARWKAANRDKINATHRAWLAERGGSKGYLRSLVSIKDRIAAVEEIKAGPCTDCGGRFPAVAMDFDHIASDRLGRPISYLVRNARWETVLAEIAKCELVCANCHRVRTAQRGEAAPRAFRKGVV